MRRSRTSPRPRPDRSVADPQPSATAAVAQNERAEDLVLDDAREQLRATSGQRLQDRARPRPRESRVHRSRNTARTRESPRRSGRTARCWTRAGARSNVPSWPPGRRSGAAGRRRGRRRPRSWRRPTGSAGCPSRPADRRRYAGRASPPSGCAARYSTTTVRARTVSMSSRAGTVPVGRASQAARSAACIRARAAACGSAHGAPAGTGLVRSSPAVTTSARAPSLPRSPATAGTLAAGTATIARSGFVGRATTDGQDGTPNTAVTLGFTANR